MVRGVSPLPRQLRPRSLTLRTFISKQAITETERWLSSEWVSWGDMLRGPIFTGLHRGEMTIHQCPPPAW